MNFKNFKDLDFDYDNIFTAIFSKKKFKIYNPYYQSKYMQFKNLDDIIKEIDLYDSMTGIIISDIPITEDNSIYLFVFDYITIIIDDIYTQKYPNFFAKIDSKLHYYLNNQCENKIKALKSKKISSKEYFLDKSNQKLIAKIKSQIVYCIIKRSQYRTSKNLQDSINFNDKNTNFIPNDFVHIQNISNIR